MHGDPRLNPPVLEVSGLVIRREEGRILNGVEWTVRSGEHWVILGANGSGKSSLLSALTGYLAPTHGQIRLLGRTFGRYDWRELRKSVGLVSTPIVERMNPDTTALETVVSGREALINYYGRISPADRRTGLRILGEIGLRRLTQRTWATLSQGEQKRVLIGRALMARHRILFLDEPCAGLDPIAREHFLRFLDRIGRGKKAPSIILVTHHVEEILPIFSMALVMKDGKAVASGPVSEIVIPEILREAFGCQVTLRRAKDGRFSLSVPASRRAAVI